MEKKRTLFIFLFIFIISTLFSKPIKVACVGNSVTLGYGIKKPDKRYPAELQKLLGNGYDVKNFGHNGATLLKKGHRPYFNLPEFKEALAFKPDIVIIHLGLNDTDPRNWAKHKDEFMRDYFHLIDTFKAINSQTEVKICRMTPIFTSHSRFKSSTREWFWQIQSTIENIAKIKQVELIDLHTPLYSRPDLFADALHPNAEGAAIIARTIYSAISKDFGGFKLASLFSDNMIIQREKPIRFWGTANAGTSVKVQFNNETKITTTKNNGSWEITFPPLKGSYQTYTATIANERKKVTLKNILIGDVWICSGQSNMEFPLKRSEKADKELPLINFPYVRLYQMRPIAETNNAAWDTLTLAKVNKGEYFKSTQWKPCTTETAADFSAVAYYFGKTIYQQINIPIGLIQNAVGGATAESWIDRKTLEHHPLLVDMFNNWRENDFIHPWCRERAVKNTELTSNNLQRHPYQPAYLYETGISQFANMNIAGVIWYQGESNEQNIELYQHIFPTLIKSWRDTFNDNFPFYYVQLSGMELGRETWGEFRDGQRRFLSSIPNTGMAVSYDVGNPQDVHPTQKREVGERLAQWALNKTYELKNIIPSGPLFKEVKFKNNAAYISFEYAENLHTSDGEKIKSFELAEHEGLFYPAWAEIIGNQIKLTSEKVRNPHFVRYGWASYTDGNLVNGANLPASTFSSK